ncbi:MAG: hypothetical protein Q7U91_16340 [Sideroxyarcus sp.]|nr:hypothetical protein [Sideroxyarcus sp.]
MNTIYLKTPAAEREESKLSVDLKRVLSLLDGRSGSDDLAKRAAPSLRQRWGELINELVKGGYIVSNPRASIEPKNKSVPKSRAAESASDSANHKLRAAEQVVTTLETAAAADKAKSHIEADRVIAALENAAAADKAKSDLAAKAKADTQQKVESAARAAELKTQFTAAKEKAAAEIKQSEQEAARARAEMQAAAAAKEKLDTEAKSRAVAKKMEQDNARTYAEFEMAIRAAKTQSDFVEKSKSELKSKSGMSEQEALHVRTLEIENEALQRLLVEAYVEIAALKGTLGTKP